MNIKIKLMKMLGYRNIKPFNQILNKYNIDLIMLFNILEANSPMSIKRDYIYSIVSEVIADHWWTYYVDEFYYKKGGWSR